MFECDCRLASHTALSGNFVGLLSIFLRAGHHLWAAWPRDCIDLVGVYAWGVEGLAPGFYVLLRGRSVQEARAACTHNSVDFAWTHPPEVPADVPLYLLRAGSRQELIDAASAASCKQVPAASFVM